MGHQSGEAFCTNLFSWDEIQRWIAIRDFHESAEYEIVLVLNVDELRAFIALFCLKFVMEQQCIVVGVVICEVFISHETSVGDIVELLDVQSVSPMIFIVRLNDGISYLSR